MVTLVGVVVAAAPFAVVWGLLAWAGWRERRRRDVRDRQIALTDVIHERLGAVAAPVLRRGRRGWQVRLGVPFERPAVTEALLAIVWEALAPRRHDPRCVEVVLIRQARAFAPEPAGARGVGRESATCT